MILLISIMNLKHWLKKRSMTQRALADRLGLEGNGFITLVAGGKRTVPGDKVTEWADALGLLDEDRQEFIDECGRECIPAWCWDRLQKAESEVRDLRSQNTALRCQIAVLKTESSRRAPPRPSTRKKK
jgi:transcriptional regulator with XRE-family HTH domain